MRVLLVEFSPSGGLFQFAVQLGEALATRGHRVDLLTGPRPELASRVPGFRVRAVLPTWHPGERGEPAAPLLRKARRAVRGLRYLAAWLTVLAVAARERPDVVQLAAFRFPMDGRFARRLARRRPVVDLVHSPRPFNEQSSSQGMFQSSPALQRELAATYPQLDALLVLGESSRDDLLATWPGARRVAVVPHGDERALAGDTDVPPADATPPRVLFFGTLTTYKGLDLLLDAVPALRVAVPEAEVVIAGAPSGDLDLGDLRRRAAQVGGVEVRAGYVPLADVGPLFGGARLVVAPYRYANASGVVHLAQTFARPVVATRVGDLPAAVQHGVTGLLVAAGDVAGLASALAALLRDPARAARLGRAGSERLAAEASWDRVAERVESVYADCLAGRLAERPGRRGGEDVPGAGTDG